MTELYDQATLARSQKTGRARLEVAVRVYFDLMGGKPDEIEVMTAAAMAAIDSIWQANKDKQR